MKKLRNWKWLGAFIAIVLTQPARAQSAHAEAQRLEVEVDKHLKNQDFNRVGLPVFLRAIQADERAQDDTLKAQHSLFAGISYYELGRLDSAASLLRQSMRLSLKIDNTPQFTQAGGYLHTVYDKQAQPDSARNLRSRLLKIYPHTKPNSQARLNLDDFLAEYYQNDGQYARALRHRLAILAFRRQRPDRPAALGIALANVGELFYLQQQYRQALRYRYEGLLELRKDPTMRATMPELHAMIAKTYREMGQLDSAKMQYDIGLRYLAANPDPNAAGYLYSELSSVLAQQGKLAEARRYSQRALASFTSSGDVDGRAQAYYFAGDLALRARDFAPARAYLRQAYTLALQLQSNDRLEPIARRLAQAEAATGNYAEAYRLRELSATLLDSAHAATGQKAMAEMEARYQNRDKQQQIKVLNNENRLRVAEAASQRRAKYLALTGVAALLLVLGLIGLLLRQRQRTAAQLARQNEELAGLNHRLNRSNAQLAEANQTKAKLFSIISHDLRAPVGNLFQLLEIIQEAPDLLDEVTRQQQTAHLRQTTRDLLDTMEELLAWSKDQLDHLDPVAEDVAILPTLQELTALYEPLAQRKSIQLTMNCPPKLHYQTDPNFLRVILRNLAQNAIKFTPESGKVSLSAEAGPDSRLTLRVSDTGPGMDAAQLAQLLSAEGAKPAAGDPAHGLGLRLTQEFVEKLGGVLTVASEPGRGSVFTVVL
ncbi:tetratricopeptide repeat-containing sensor histidine kinase [Hymenobacter sp. ASUV-10]|uniref:histidine kinase n=1 Tax=Hymenobacter aranciens TaxID=3063996 RepID=A0ABT9BG36_9BACT|nr:tetratricopeptide repeat-containing sensor histidine kinase [Hymenobacter sp. ASUV-10]MDO7877216.1 tetratricopeptide repeat-containing sensor histidine kinase [Hymenobacter sp. ASUV-10]